MNGKAAALLVGLGFGAGAESRRPLGLAVAGDLLFIQPLYHSCDIIFTWSFLKEGSAICSTNKIGFPDGREELQDPFDPVCLLNEFLGFGDWNLFWI